MQYGKLYEEGTRILADAGIEEREAKLDARFLLEHVCGTTLQTLLLNKERPVSAEEEGAYRELIAQRRERVPLSYITGKRDFMGLTFEVTRDVLIPEQDTENLVEEALRLIDDGSRILDLCTGSGCILLSLLRYTNGCQGVGTDISGAALEIARRNGESLGLSDRAVWLQGDLFAALSDTEEKNSPALHSSASEFPFPSALNLQRPAFDLIISNPPYIPTDVIATLAPEVSICEPRLALDGGQDGLDFYRRIIREAPDFLVIGGRLMLEIGYNQAEAVSCLLQEAGYYGIEVLKDYGGNDRIVTAVCSMAQKRG